MNRVATIVPVLGIGLRFSSVTKIDERESNVNSLTVGVYGVPTGLTSVSRKKGSSAISTIESSVAFRA